MYSSLPTVLNAVTFKFNNKLGKWVLLYYFTDEENKFKEV